MPLLCYDKDTEQTHVLTETVVSNAELDERGYVTIYLKTNEANKCYYLVLDPIEFEEVKNPFDLNKPDGQTT